MKAKILAKTKNKNYIDIYFAIVVFITFLIICECSPLTGDDWGNYINGSGGIIYSIRYAFFSYKSYEGRIISRVLINILTYHKYVWNVLNPLIIASIYYLILKISYHKDKYITPILVFLAFLLVDEQAFRQIYVWLAGNITYLFPMLTIFCFVYLNRKLHFEDSKKIRILLPIITFITSIFVETASICIIVSYLFYLIYYYIERKKFNKTLIISLICSIMGLLIMLLSPGTSNRLDTYPEFSELSIIGKFLYNIPNFINFTFIRNSLLILLISFSIILLTYKYLKKRLFRYLIYIYMSAFPLLSAAINYLKTFGFGLSKLDIILDVNKWYIVVFWLGYMVIMTIIIFIYLLKSKDIITLSLIIIGIMGNASMMISPVWGGRTAYITTICLSVAMINIINKFDFVKNNNRYVELFLGFGLSVFVIFFLWGYINVYRSNKLREKIIFEQLQSNSEQIDVIVLSERFLWNPNPWDENGYLARTLKLYYKIDSDKHIKLKYLNSK